jgi:hypothetical protein
MITRRLFFPCSSFLQLQAYSDATWASDPLDRHSLYAYCVFLGGSLIVWTTKKQTAVSCSSAEAELRAMASLTAEVIWLRWLLEDFWCICKYTNFPIVRLYRCYQHYARSGEV